MNVMMGLAGVEGAGKSTLAAEVSELGVLTISTRGLVEHTAAAEGFIPDEGGRDPYLPFVHEWSKTHGEDWVARIALETMAAAEVPVLLEGIRMPADASTILKYKGHMFWLDAPLPVAGQRVLKRQRDIDSGITTVEAYIERMQAQLDNTGRFSLGAVKERCTRILKAAPDIENPAIRAAHNRALGWHMLDCIDFAPGLLPGPVA